MGFKSVQVRAGVGMKIVDGTLQRKQSQAKVSAKAPISAGKKMTGPPGSISSTTPAAAGAAAVGGGDATRMTPEFVRMRPALYLSAWAAMVEASAFEVDASGDIAPAFVQVWYRALLYCGRRCDVACVDCCVSKYFFLVYLECFFCSVA